MSSVNTRKRSVVVGAKMRIGTQKAIDIVWGTTRNMTISIPKGSCEERCTLCHVAELDARMALVNDPDFRRYVNDDCDVCDSPKCNVDLATQYENYLGFD